jgi:hypothetical protein
MLLQRMQSIIKLPKMILRMPMVVGMEVFGGSGEGEGAPEGDTKLLSGAGVSMTCSTQLAEACRKDEDEKRRAFDSSFRRFWCIAKLRRRHAVGLI